MIFFNASRLFGSIISNIIYIVQVLYIVETVVNLLLFSVLFNVLHQIEYKCLKPS